MSFIDKVTQDAQSLYQINQRVFGAGSDLQAKREAVQHALDETTMNMTAATYSAGVLANGGEQNIITTVSNRL